MAFALGKKTSRKDGARECRAVTGLRNKSLRVSIKWAEGVGGLSQSKEAKQGGVTVLGDGEIVLALRRGAEG